MSETDIYQAPSLAEIRASREELGDLVVTTPVIQWRSREKDRLLGDTEVSVKLELLQYGGSFKPRGALMQMFGLSQDALVKGVTAVSAGNHAIAVSYAAKVLGTKAKVVMPQSANPFRVQRCRDLGTEVVLVENVSLAFDEVERIQNEEGMFFVHPFEGKLAATGTGTAGLEFIEQAPDLDAVIVPIGGGGLAAGMSAAIRQFNPHVRIFGVEPTGADSMSRSFASGQPKPIPSVRTVADSLGAPFAMPYSYSLCRRFIERIVLVDDPMLRNTMRLMFTEMKLAVEPAGAASLSALLGPLKEELQGKHVGIVACGSNIDLKSFFTLVRDSEGW
ncbi:MAG: threonine/serine dehydratase [Bacteroidota bacterium]